MDRAFPKAGYQGQQLFGQITLSFCSNLSLPGRVGSSTPAMVPRAAEAKETAECGNNTHTR